MWPKNVRPAAALALLILLPCAALAADKIDLERVAPVPADQPIPLQDFFRPLLFRRPVLNATGSHFAALVDTGRDHTALLICDLEKSSIRVLQGSSNKDISSLAWLDEQHLLMDMTADKQYASGVFIANATDLDDNYSVENYSATALVGVPKDSPMKPLLWIYRNAYDDGRDMGVRQIDARKRLGRNRDSDGSALANKDQDDFSAYGTSASIVKSYPGPPRGEVADDYMADKDGNLAFLTTVKSGVFTLYRLADNRWQKCPVDLDDLVIIAAGDQAGELIVAGPREEGKPRPVQRLDAITGKLGEVLLQDKAYDLTNSSVYRHPATKNVIGLWFERSGLQTAWFDENYRTVQKILAGYFPGQIVSILGSDREQNRFFVSSYSDRQPVTYYVMDLKARSLKLVKCAAPWIDPKRMQAMNIFKFKTRDGHQLEGYLTLPAGASKQNPAPLVVLPHGGPHVRDAWGYNGEVQFLASRGYAVLQPNYRGSPGYTWMFPGDLWAFRKMHDDVTDAVKAAKASGLVDPGRIAIMGGSFGGYLALCGAAFEPDLYRCAVTVAGVFDWEQMLREKKQDRYSDAAFGIYLRALGDPKTEQEKFAAISPLRHVDQVRIPVFVAHGKDDPVVDADESRRLIAELEKFHVPHEVLLVGGEGHGMDNLDNQVKLYGRIEAFLAKNLAPTTAAAPATPVAAP
jgi:dipeptidyl aminopeptidase/acylaminoacyl peptidase